MKFYHHFRDFITRAKNAAEYRSIDCVHVLMDIEKTE